jgi:murein L,D-transpeptidase YcbB/YkuD
MSKNILYISALLVTIVGMVFSVTPVEAATSSTVFGTGNIGSSSITIQPKNASDAIRIANQCLLSMTLGSVATNTAAQIASSNKSFQDCLIKSATSESTATATTNVNLQPIVFIRNLSLGSEGNDVLSLQQFLNASGYAIAGVGSGSIGNETIHFGVLTKNALMKFQKDHGLPPTGFFGSLTRAFMAKL